jgi:hypothetical protein
VFQDKGLAILGERQTRSNDQDQQDRENSRFHGISPLFEIGLLFLETLPIIFDPLHEPLESFFAADVLEEGVVLVEKWVIDKPKADRVFQLVQGFCLFVKQGKRIRSI